MQSKLTFSILFWTYAARSKNNKTNIYVRITVNGQKANISLKQKVDLHTWDSKRQKSKGNSVKSRTVNLYLDEVKTDIFQCYRDLKQEGKVLTANLIKSRYLGEDIKIHSLLDIFEYHNTTLAHKLSAKTLCHYRTSQKYILQIKDLPTQLYNICDSI